MKKHTPGPWQATQEMANRWRITAFVSEDLVPDSLAIVTHTVLGMGGNGENTEANARLIAAAPELLGALIDLLRYEQVLDDGDPKLESARESARAAIAKATS